ncbi:HAUS augmin-like complex subunit 5 [Rhinoderma darwinii]|uniref:HAUS augmin-like complex subunit 5 n=1 Tax=Rhinoderma darwinii TaxID=43563 RepID=UPI003F679E35
MDRRSLALELRRWVVEEMGLPQQKAPTEDMLQRLFIGQHGDIWKYVIRHVRSQRTVKNIEGNLLWYQQLQHSEAQRSAEKEEQQRRKQLCQEVLELRLELRHLQEQIQSAEREIVSQELNNHKSQDFRRRSLLLRAYNSKREEECEALRESNVRIRYRCDQLQDVSRASQRETVFPALDAGSALNTFPAPEVLRDVRGVCQMRFKFLRSLHDDTVSGSLLSGGEDLRSLAHHQWMSTAETVWSSHPPNHIVSSLEHLTLETTRDMRHLQSSLSVDPTETSCSVSETTGDSHETRDNQEASRHTRSAGAGHDSSGGLPSFGSLIQDGWAESVRVTSRLRGVQRQSRELSALMADKIQEVHGTLSDGSEISVLSRAAFDAELRSVLLRGCQDALLQECRALRDEAADRKQEVKHLQQQQKNIQESSLLLDKKQKQIQVLIKGNSSSKTQIRCSGAEVQRYVQEKLIPRPQEVVQESQRLQDSVMKDVKHFSSISLPALQKVGTDGTNLVPAQELSINRVTNPHFPYYAIYKGLYASVGLSLYKAPENVLRHVAEMKNRLLFLRSQLRSRNQTVAKIQRRLRESQSPDIDTLLQLLSVHYAQQTDELVPKLQRLIEQCEKSQEYGKEVQASVTDWWEQPAQLSLPWERRGDQTLRQWRDRWTVAVTALQRAAGGRS